MAEQVCRLAAALLLRDAVLRAAVHGAWAEQALEAQAIAGAQARLPLGRRRRVRVADLARAVRALDVDVRAEQRVDLAGRQINNQTGHGDAGETLAKAADGEHEAEP